MVSNLAGFFMPITVHFLLVEFLQAKETSSADIYF